MSLVKDNLVRDDNVDNIISGAEDEIKGMVNARLTSTEERMLMLCAALLEVIKYLKSKMEKRK